jgi:hypothetical protein
LNAADADRVRDVPGGAFAPSLHGREPLKRMRPVGRRVPMVDHAPTRSTTDRHPNAPTERRPTSTDAIESDRETGDEAVEADVAERLRAVADGIDALAESLPIGAARHHARRAAAAARETADDEAPLVARRVAVGELVTELRAAADEAAATRDQYELLQFLYEEALPATRAAGAVVYGR